jgi:hypothetical protein
VVNSKQNPFSPDYFENPKEEPSDAEPPKALTMTGKQLTFVFDLLLVLNAYLLAKRQGLPFPKDARYRKGLSPVKIVERVQALIGLEIELFSRHDFYNNSVSSRDRMFTQFCGAYQDVPFEVDELMESFVPPEFSEDAKTRARAAHRRILGSVATGRITREQVTATEGEAEPDTGGRNPFEG